MQKSTGPKPKGKVKVSPSLILKNNTREFLCSFVQKPCSWRGMKVLLCKTAILPPKNTVRCWQSWTMRQHYGHFGVLVHWTSKKRRMSRTLILSARGNWVAATLWRGGVSTSKTACGKQRIIWNASVYTPVQQSWSLRNWGNSMMSRNTDSGNSFYFALRIKVWLIPPGKKVIKWW